MVNTLEFIIASITPIINDFKNKGILVDAWWMRVILPQVLEGLQELQDLKQNFSVLGSRLNKAEREKEALRLDNQELQERLAQSELRLREAEKRNTDLYQEAVELKRDKVYIQRAWEARAKDCADYAKTVAYLESKIVQLENQLSRKEPMNTDKLRTELASQKALTDYWKRLFWEKKN